jgi:hypothetical protein
MKSVLVLAILSVVVVAAMAAKSCGTIIEPRDCEGPVRKSYSGNKCSGTVDYSERFGPGFSKSGECHSRGSGKYDGSFKFWCGTSLTQRDYTTNDCKGPYSYSSSPTKKCFENDDSTKTSYEYLCASASNISASALLLVAMAILAILNL